MAETILFNIASRVLQKVGSLALKEFGLAWGFDNELKSLEGTLSMIKAALLPDDMDHGEKHHQVLNIWLERLQDAFYHADNVIDEFHYQALQRQVLICSGGWRIRVKVHDFFLCLKMLVSRSEMRRKIRYITERLDRIAEDRSKFCVTRRSPGERTRGFDDASSISTITESDFVGRVNDKEAILSLLIDSSVVEKISVIPIVGPGGLGKTSLVKLMYKDARVIAHFKLLMWVTLSSQDFKCKYIMQKLVECITDSPCTNFTKNQLRKLFQDNLNTRKFLLVLDDVRNCEYRNWVKFCKLLRGGAHGSKIIVTTRDNSVASTMGFPKYDLEGLSDKDCQELLLKWAGCEKVGQQYVNLLEIASEIVKKCHGYPLAAKTLGSLLFMKTDENEWWYLKESELWELVQNKSDILPVLKLSYDPLPPDLKRCFLYCSLFPKCYEIEVDKLIQLWMAQGHIQSSRVNHELEDIGVEYLNHLCSINFLEKIHNQYGNLSKCQMPEIIHDLAVFIAEKEYVGIASCVSGNFIPKGKRVAHVSVRNYDVSMEPVAKSLVLQKEYLRSVHYIPCQRLRAIEEEFVETCISRLKYVRMLDLSGSCFSVVPQSIGDLKHLRFLDLSWNASIKTLPNSICKLYNLQTLRIWYCTGIQKLPEKLGNLINLRHLYLTTQQSCLLEKQIQCLTSLQTLGFAGCGNLTSLPQVIQLLAALRTMTITACPNLTSLPIGMRNMANLRNIEISKCPKLNLSGWEHIKGLKILQSNGILQVFEVRGSPQNYAVQQDLPVRARHSLRSRFCC